MVSFVWLHVTSYRGNRTRNISDVTLTRSASACRSEICVYTYHNFIFDFLYNSICKISQMKISWIHGLRVVQLHCTIGHTATHCNTLQHMVAHCNTLQHTCRWIHSLRVVQLHCTIGAEGVNTQGACTYIRMYTYTHCNIMYVYMYESGISCICILYVYTNTLTHNKFVCENKCYPHK